MTQEQFLNGIVLVVTGGFILVVWTWRTVRPYLVLRDIRTGAIKPETDVLWFLGPQAALFLILPVVAFTSWRVRQPWAIVIFVGMFVSGCSTAYFGIKTWTEVNRKKRESSNQALHGTAEGRADASPGSP
jgi:drug/metabolite transporter (DMT)-like permease